MRIWHINYSYLDSRRLTSQHFECHGLLSLILAGGHWGSISKEFELSCDYIKAAHDKAIAEMSIRASIKGKNKNVEHSSTMPEIPDKFKVTPYTPTREKLVYDVESLRDKWEKEGYYFGIGREDLRALERHYGMKVGRAPFEANIIHQRTVLFLKQHRDVFVTCEGKLYERLEEVRRRVGLAPSANS